MRKSLFDESVKEETISRIFQLNEDTRGEWGQMEVTQMLLHLNTSLKAILSAKAKRNKHKGTLKEWVLRNLFLYVVTRIPRDAPTRPDLDVVGSQLDTNSFEEERTELIKLLNQFQRTKEINAIHPVFGKLNTIEWGTFTWMHVDHHLRQFDV